ncbi:hypothetical protein OROGR_013438 [Orobanche gracilis]
MKHRYASLFAIAPLFGAIDNYGYETVCSETILQIKEKLHELIDQTVNDQRLMLMPNKEELDDSKLLADHRVENGAIVALTLRKDDDEFEEVNIVGPNDFYQPVEAYGGGSC